MPSFIHDIDEFYDGEARYTCNCHRYDIMGVVSRQIVMAVRRGAARAGVAAGGFSP